MLEKHSLDRCRKCGKKFQLQESAWHNKHENVYGGSKTKWYCKKCYDLMWM